MNVNEVIEKLTAKMEHNNGLAKDDAVDAIEVIKELSDEVKRLKSFENTSHYWHKKCNKLIDKIETTKSECGKRI